MLSDLYETASFSLLVVGVAGLMMVAQLYHETKALHCVIATT